MIGTLLLVLAQDVDKPSAAWPAWWHVLLNNSLAIMLILIFVTAIIGTFVNQRKRDRCLKKFGGYSVTIIEQGGRAIWGRLRVFSSGLEVLFSKPFSDDRRTYKESFLYYPGELPRLLTITRYLDEITEKGHRRRGRQIRKMARPGILTRTNRRLRNLVNTFRDAIGKSFSVAVSQAQKTSQASVMKVGAGDITGLGTTIIGEAGNAYEPMLEQYFGREVIAELVNPVDPDKKTIEITGFLGEYSASNILLVNCKQSIDDRITIPEDRHLLLAQQLEASRQGKTVTVHHDGTYPAAVTGVRWGETAQQVAVDLPPGTGTALELSGEPPPGATVEVLLRAERTFDVIIPRAVAMVRHRARFAEDQS